MRTLFEPLLKRFLFERLSWRSRYLEAISVVLIVWYSRIKTSRAADLPPMHALNVKKHVGLVLRCQLPRGRSNYIESSRRNIGQVAYSVDCLVKFGSVGLETAREYLLAFPEHSWLVADRRKRPGQKHLVLTWCNFCRKFGPFFVGRTWDQGLSHDLSCWCSVVSYVMRYSSREKKGGRVRYSRCSRINLRLDIFLLGLDFKRSDR